MVIAYGIALSIQDRWLFIQLLASWVACATYLMSGQRNQYFCSLPEGVVLRVGTTASVLIKTGD